MFQIDKSVGATLCQFGFNASCTPHAPIPIHRVGIPFTAHPLIAMFATGFLAAYTIWALHCGIVGLKQQFNPIFKFHSEKTIEQARHIDAFRQILD